MRMVSGWVAVCLSAVAPLTGLSQSPFSNAQCPRDMTAQEQERIFSRAVVLGASYSHGCSACDVLQNLRIHNEASDDAHWIRRHPIIQFYLNYQWKNPQAVAGPYVHIVENEPGPRRPSMRIPDWQLKTGVFHGQWLFMPHEESLVLPNKATRDWLMSIPEIAQDVALVGGVPQQKEVGPRTGSLQGSLYQFITPHTSGGNPPLTIFDLSKDGSTVFDVFQAHIPPHLYNRLYERGWADTALRFQAVQALAQRIIRFKPSVVMAPDALFWDSIALTLATLQEENPNHLGIKLMMRVMDRGGGGHHHVNPTMRENIKQDYLAALALVARSGGGVPVYVGRLLDNPIKHFESSNTAPFIGAAVVQFFESVTGMTLPPNLVQSLTQQPLSPQEEALLERTKTLQNAPNGLVQAAINVAVGTVLKDQKLLFDALNRSFNLTNAMLDQFVVLNPETIKVMDFSTFYKDFVSYLKPETMHPSVLGAKRLAGLLEPGMCQIPSGPLGLNP